MKTVVLLLLCAALAAPCAAADPAGTVVEARGDVFVHRQNGPRGERVEAPETPLFVGDSVRTKPGASAFVRFPDGSKAVVQEESVLTIHGREALEAGDGRVLFDVRPQGAVRGLRVASKVALIGVKGTRFAVETAGEQVSVFLKEGLLDVEAKEGLFERIRPGGEEGGLERLDREFEEKLEDMNRRFESQRQQMDRDFEEQKRRMDQAFSDFVKRFEMPAGTAVVIAGGVARDVPTPAEVHEAFLLLDEF